MKPTRMCYTQMDLLSRRIDIGEANESHRIFVNVLDAAIRTFNNIKTSLLGAFSDFKRSELRAWQESHVTGFKKLMTDKNVTLYRELVPIPHQFNTTYSSAISIINDDLRKLDIEKTVDLFWVYLSELDDLLKGGKVSEAVTSTKKTKHEIDKVSRDDLNSSFGKMFSTDQTKEYLPFKEVIGTYKDIERINWHILAYEALFRVVSTICQKIDRIEKKVTLIITTLESNKNPDLALVKAFHDLVYAFAVQCDALGVVLHHIQRVEHNWVLALDKLTKLNLEKK